MPAAAELDELVAHLVGASRLSRAEVERLVGEVIAFLNEEAEAYVRRRHQELQSLGVKNDRIFSQIEIELTQRRFAAPAYTRRQLRRIIYG